jgi:hypothetical protein
VLAEQESKAGNFRQAANAMEIALLLDPYDYWLAGRRTEDASRLWPFLSTSAQDDAIRQTRLLWIEPQLRTNLLLLLGTTHGQQLLQKAFGTDFETLRAINRWASAARRTEIPLR